MTKRYPFYTNGRTKNIIFPQQANVFYFYDKMLLKSHIPKNVTGWSLVSEEVYPDKKAEVKTQIQNKVYSLLRRKPEPSFQIDLESPKRADITRINILSSRSLI